MKDARKNVIFLQERQFQLWLYEADIQLKNKETQGVKRVNSLQFLKRKC